MRSEPMKGALQCALSVSKDATLVRFDKLSAHTAPARRGCYRHVTAGRLA